MLPALPTGKACTSGAVPSASTISKAAVFWPSMRTGLTELTYEIVWKSATILRASSRQSSKLPSIWMTLAPCITAYWKGYTEYHADGLIDKLPRMLGTQAAGAAPLVLGAPVSQPETIATAIRIGSPASWASAVEAQQQSKGRFLAATDDEILAAYHLVAGTEGVFVEPASAASIAGLLKAVDDGWVAAGSTVVCTVTGNGLKDPDTALRDMPSVSPVPVDPVAVVAKLGLV